MSNIWVCKQDESHQSDPESEEISLEEMRIELAGYIGDENIISMEKRFKKICDYCGKSKDKGDATLCSYHQWVASPLIYA